jgi:hypothetical protein
MDFGQTHRPDAAKPDTFAKPLVTLAAIQRPDVCIIYIQQITGQDLLLTAKHSLLHSRERDI